MYSTIAKAVKAGKKMVEIKMSEIGFNLSYGNTKLEKTDNSEFMIWSITSDYSEKFEMHTCPLATPMCKKMCYAKKAERMYPSVNNRRESNLEESLKASFVADMIELIEFEMSRKKFTGKHILFRIHEAGDFYSVEYMEKWVTIANHFQGKDITFLAYTKSLPYVAKMYAKFGKENVNIQFKSSIWEDTSKAMVNMTKALDLTVFTAVTETQLKEDKDYSDYFKCPSMSGLGCGTCAEKSNFGCYGSQSKDTAIVIH